MNEMDTPQVITMKRKPNWSSEESVLLLQLVEERKAIIKSKLGPGITSRIKKEAWGQVAANINSQFPNVVRSAEDCEKRWYNIKSKSRQPASAFKRQLNGTGEPSPSKQSTFSEAVYDVLGQSNGNISGIQGSFDSTLMHFMDMSNSFQDAATPSSGSEACSALPRNGQATPLPSCISASPCTVPLSLPCTITGGDVDDHLLLRKKTLLQIDVLQLKKKYLMLKIEKTRQDKSDN